MQSVFDCKLAIDRSGYGHATDKSGYDHQVDCAYNEYMELTVYIDGQDNINKVVDEGLKQYIQDHVHSVYPLVSIRIFTHNSYAVCGPW